MDYGKLLPHLRAPNKKQQHSNINDKITNDVQAEPRSSFSSIVHSMGSTGSSDFAWSGIRLNKADCNVHDPPAVKSTPSAWNEYANQASSSRASTVRQQPASKAGWNGSASEASSSKASFGRQQPVPEASLLDMPLPHLDGKSMAAAQAPKPTKSMNAGKLAKSAKYDSKVPCTYEDCTRGFTKETDMKRHKDEDHDWCRLCNVDCVDDLAVLEHKVQSERHICCDVCGEDFRSETGKERHMRQVSLWSWFQSVRTTG